jgi:hypothetical protein
LLIALLVQFWGHSSDLIRGRFSPHYDSLRDALFRTLLGMMRGPYSLRLGGVFVNNEKLRVLNDEHKTSVVDKNALSDGVKLLAIRHTSQACEHASRLRRPSFSMSADLTLCSSHIHILEKHLNGTLGGMIL